MTRPRPGIGSELLPLVMIVLSLAGTLTLVVSVYRRAQVKTKATVAVQTPAPAAVPTAQPVVVPPPVEPEESPKDEPPPPPPLPPPPPQPHEDPTKKALGHLADAEANERLEARKADARAAALESARRAAIAKSERARRRVALVRAQVDELTAKADRLEQDAQTLATERDVLARERDLAKAALQKARTTSSYAVLPNKAPNGTWRRPIVIECSNGQVTLQPNGPTFSMLQISELMGFRASPIVKAVARELIRLEGTATPDGAPSVPYIFFVVRPDGIRPYYEARARLEPLGIAFGYELVDQDWEIEYPEPDRGAGGSGGSTENHLGPTAANRGELTWPGDANRNQSADSFVWPARPTAGIANRGGGADQNRRGFAEGAGLGDGPDHNHTPGREGDDEPSVSGAPAGGLGGWPSARGGMAGSGSSGDTGDGARGTFSSPSRGRRSGFSEEGGASDEGQGGSRGFTPGGVSGRSPGGTLGNSGSRPGLTGNGGRPGERTFGSSRSLKRQGESDSGGLDSDVPRELPPLMGPGEVSSAGSGANARNVAGSRGSSGSRSATSGAAEHGSGSRADALDLDALPPPLPSSGNPSGEESADPAARPFAGGNAIGSPVRDGNATPPNGSAASGHSPSSVAMREGAAGLPPAVPGSASGNPAGARGSADDASDSNGDNGSGSTPSTESRTSPSGRSSASKNTTATQGSANQSGDPSGAASNSGIPIPFSNADASDPPPMKKRPSWYEPRRVETRMDIVVVCEWNGVVIHPGAYRLTTKALKSGSDVLVDQLERLVEHRAEKDLLIRLHPHVEFLVEPGGSDTYKLARQQLFSSGHEWPVSVQVAETSGTSAKPKGMLR